MQFLSTQHIRSLDAGEGMAEVDFSEAPEEYLKKTTSKLVLKELMMKKMVKNINVDQQL
ncbi:hypothetical protein P3S67_008004 [Capsicum chacoense]